VGLATKSDAYFYENHSAFYDVTSGNNDPRKLCDDVMCNAGPGWDGPTGWGTPNGAALVALAVTGGRDPSGSKGCACAVPGRASPTIPTSFYLFAAVGGALSLTRRYGSRRHRRNATSM
jgi:hypothetical protein